VVSIQKPTGTKWNPASLWILWMWPDHSENFGHQCVFVKTILKQVWRCELDWSGSGYGSTVTCYKNIKKKIHFMITRSFLHQTNYQLLSKNDYVTARHSARRWFLTLRQQRARADLNTLSTDIQFVSLSLSLLPPPSYSLVGQGDSCLLMTSSTEQSTNPLQLLL